VRAVADARSRQRELLQRALRGEDTPQDLREVAERIAQHDDTHARRVVRKIAEYRGEEHQLRDLQQSVDALELRLAGRRAAAQSSLELQQLAAELGRVLQEEEELLQLYEEIEHDDRILLLTAVSGRLPM
jgi:aminoglycoside phosphotransferase family enzyme